MNEVRAQRRLIAVIGSRPPAVQRPPGQLLKATNALRMAEGMRVMVPIKARFHIGRDTQRLDVVDLAEVMALTQAKNRVRAWS